MVIVFAYLLIFIFRHYPSILIKLEILLRVKDVPGTIMLALPFAYALGSLLNFFLIWIMFRKDFLHDNKIYIFKGFIESLTSAIVMGIVAYIFLGVFSNIFNLDTGKGIFLQGFLSGIIGMASGVSVLFILKNKELFDIIHALKNKFWRNRVIAPEQTEL